MNTPRKELRDHTELFSIPQYHQTAQRMKAPFEQKPVRSQRAVLLDEFRLCMAAAVGCSVVGLVTTAYHRWQGQSTPFAALLVVGGFYTIMGLGRLMKYFSTPVNSAPKDPAGH